MRKAAFSSKSLRNPTSTLVEMRREAYIKGKWGNVRSQRVEALTSGQKISQLRKRTKNLLHKVGTKMDFMHRLLPQARNYTRRPCLPVELVPAAKPWHGTAGLLSSDAAHGLKQQGEQYSLNQSAATCATSRHDQQHFAWYMQCANNIRLASSLMGLHGCPHFCNTNRSAPAP